jgi:hypothetical protein
MALKSKKTLKNNMEFNEIIKNNDLDQEEIEADGVNSIVCMNLSEAKYYIYDTNGILRNRVNYAKIVEQFGDPICSSNNGQYFLFKQTSD